MPIEHLLIRLECGWCGAVLRGEEPDCQRTSHGLCFGCWTEMSESLRLESPNRELTNKMLYPNGIHDELVVLGGEA